MAKTPNARKAATEKVDGPVPKNTPTTGTTVPVKDPASDFVEGQAKTKTDDDAALAAANAKVTKDVVPSAYRDRYTAGNGTCGDFIATEISAMTKEGGVPTINAIKSENSIPEAKWSGLNNGMQRMNLANTLRAAYLRGETIRIGGREHSLHTAKAEFEGDGAADDSAFDADKDMASFIKMIDVQDTPRTRAAIAKAFGPNPAEAREAKKAEREKAKADKAEDKAKAAADKAEAKAAADKAKAEEKAKAAADKAEAKAAADKAKAEEKEKAAAAKAEAKAAADKAKADDKAAKEAAKAEAKEKAAAETK